VCTHTSSSSGRMDTQYVAIETEGTGSPRQEPSNKGRYVIGGIVIAVVCIVGVIVGTTSNHGNTEPRRSNSPQSSSNAQASAASPDFAKHFDYDVSRPTFALHPVLGYLNSTGVVNPADPEVIHYSTHYDLVTPNHFTHLHAEVDAVRNAYVLSKDMDALQVACLEASILVKFKSVAAAKAFAANITVSTVIPLEEEWNCTMGAHVRKAKGTTTISGTIVSVLTFNASVSDLYRDATISYNGTGFGTPAYPNSHPTPLNVPSSRQRRSWLSHAWHVITHVVGFAVTGDLDVDKKLYSTDFTMGPAPCAGPAHGSETQTQQQIRDITQCQFHAGLAIVFDLQISHYHIDNVELYALGTMNGDVTTNGQSLDHTWSGSYSYTIFDSTLFSISIPVAGFPLPIKLTGALYAHPRWSLTGDLTIDSDIHTSGELKFGLQYTPETHVQPIRVDTLHASADFNSATGVFTLDGSIGMDAVFQLSALYVANAHVDVTTVPSFHGVATETIMGPGGESVNVNGRNVTTHRIAAHQPVSYGQCTPTANANDPVDNPSFQLSAQVDVDVTAGANIDVDILHHTLYDHTFNFGTLYSHDWSFGPWCRHIDV